MPATLIGRKKLRKPGVPTLKTKDHPKGRSGLAGHEDRLPAFIKLTLKLKREGLYLHEIAERIAKDYNLDVVPHITTVAKWRNEGLNAVNDDIHILQTQVRVDQFIELEQLKAKWMPLATSQRLEITRWRSVEGTLQPELDENALQEQLDATKAIVAIMARQAKLLGLDIEKAITPEGDGPTSLQSLQVWLIGQIQNQPANGTPIDIKGEVLELAAGLPESDAV